MPGPLSSTAATIDYAPHIEAHHQDMMGGTNIAAVANWTYGAHLNIQDIIKRISTYPNGMSAAQVPGASPWYNSSAGTAWKHYNQGPDLAAIETRLAVFEADLSLYSGITHTQSSVDAAIGKLATTIDEDPVHLSPAQLTVQMARLDPVDYIARMTTATTGWIDKLVAKLTAIATTATDVVDAQLRATELKAIVDAMSPTVDMGAFFDAALAKIDVSLLPSSRVDTVAAAFETRGKSAFNRSLGRTAAGLFDIRSVMSSQFEMTMAAMELERAQEVNDFDARARLQNEQQRADVTIQLTSQVAQLREIQARSKEVVAQVQFAIDQLENSLNRTDAQIKSGNMQLLLSTAQSLEAMKEQLIDANIKNYLDHDRNYHMYLENTAQTRASFVQAITSDMARGQMMRLTMGLDASRATMEQRLKKITTRQDEIGWNIVADEKDALWDANLMAHISGVLSSINGAPAFKEKNEFDRRMEMVSMAASLVGPILAIL